VERPDCLEPVQAYEHVAPFFGQIAERRSLYLQAVEQMIVARVPQASRSLLDVGAGNGLRASHIAQSAKLTDVVLLEPSAAMRKRAAGSLEIWPIKAEELQSAGPEFTARRFDVITCLWNVLGHVATPEARRAVLQNLGKLLNPCGALFLDVTHRYNARSYGWTKTIGRFLFDKLRPSERNGDVTVTWEVDGIRCSTFGHVFTDEEIRRIAGSAGLTVEEMLVVDYETGEQSRYTFQGNLFYVLRRDSFAMQSFNTEQTSSVSASVS
jgi:SAM-dependent methyltransferase